MAILRFPAVTVDKLKQLGQRKKPLEGHLPSDLYICARTSQRHLAELDCMADY